MFSAFKIQDNLIEFDRVTKSGNQLVLLQDGKRIEVNCIRREGNRLLLELHGESRERLSCWVDILQADRNHEFRILYKREEISVKALHDAFEAESEQADYRAPMTAKVIEVLVAEGDSVEAGQTLMVLEAMKLQLDIKAQDIAKVAQISVEAGNQVQQGDLLIHMEE